MSSNIKQYIEKKFRESASSGELFDSFQHAIKLKIKDLDMYKILLANMALSADEIKLFTEKLCNEFEDLKYDIYMWSAAILESSLSIENLETAFNYYKKAGEIEKTNHLPFVSILRMYNADIDIPPKESIIEVVGNAAKDVKLKGFFYKEMAEFYGRLGDQTTKRKYLILAAKYGKGSQSPLNHINCIFIK